jgi:uncharacterized membrane protein YjgN (DUF898 family)
VADELNLSLNDSLLLSSAIVAGVSALLFAFMSQQSRLTAIRVLAAILHIPLIAFWVGFAWKHNQESTRLASLMVDAGYGSSAVLAVRESLWGIPLLVVCPLILVAPFAIYAQWRLDVTWGWKKGESKIDEDKVLLWSLLPFSICLLQVILGAILGLSIILCAVECDTI